MHPSLIAEGHDTEEHAAFFTEGLQANTAAIQSLYIGCREQVSLIHGLCSFGGRRVHGYARRLRRSLLCRCIYTSSAGVITNVNTNPISSPITSGSMVASFVRRVHAPLGSMLRASTVTVDWRGFLRYLEWRGVAFCYA